MNVLAHILLASCLAVVVSNATHSDDVLRCSISAAPRMLEPGQPTVVSVAIRNISGQAVDFRVKISFDLMARKSEQMKASDGYTAFIESFWANRAGQSRPADPDLNKPVHLDVGQEIEAAFDLSQLHWECWICSDFRGGPNLFRKVRNGIYRMSFTAWGKTVDGRSIKMTSTDQHVFVLANMPLAHAIRNGTPIFSVVLVLLLWLFFKRRTNSLVVRRSQAIPENRLHEV